MIVVDTSAIVAIVFGEPEREAFVRILEVTDKALILPRLYKGDDFAQTDIVSASAPG